MVSRFDFSQMVPDKEVPHSSEAEAKMPGTYQEQYPGDSEGRTALSEMRGYFERSRKLEGLRERDKSVVRAELEQLSQYQFLLTDFVLKNGQDRKQLQLFWNTAKSLAGQENFSIDFKKLRQGVLSQTATYKIFERLGLHPQLSHPSQDTGAAIDMWIGEDRAVQVKNSYERDIMVLDTAEENLSQRVTEEGAGNNVISLDFYLGHEMSKFRQGLQRFAASTHQSVQGYLVLMPRGGFDSVTGEPNAQAVRQMAEKLSVSSDRLEEQKSETQESVSPSKIASLPMIRRKRSSNLICSGVLTEVGKKYLLRIKRRVLLT